MVVPLDKDICILNTFFPEIGLFGVPCVTMSMTMPLSLVIATLTESGALGYRRFVAGK